MATLRAVVFDSDGTLLDSFELIVAAYQHVAERHNLKVPSPDDARLQLGRPLPDIIESLFPGQNIQELLHTNNSYFAKNVLMSTAFEGLNEMLGELSLIDLRLAVLTSGGHKIHNILDHHNINHYFTSGGHKIHNILDHHNINHYFTSVVHHERIYNYKPHPEGFLLAVKECGVQPEETIMVGDTVVGIQTGKNSGAMATIALTHGSGTREDLIAEKPDYLANDLNSVTKIISTLATK
jgi:pyrophosphatase PpaX